MVGRLSRMRVSSVIAIFPSRSSVGTLKSTRTRTRRPRTSRSRRASLFMLTSFVIALVLLLVLAFLVPKLCLGMPLSRQLCCPAAKQGFENKCVPKQSLGTRTPWWRIHIKHHEHEHDH